MRGGGVISSFYLPLFTTFFLFSYIYLFYYFLTLLKGQAVRHTLILRAYVALKVWLLSVELQER
ncbi:MAG: hypothetical protein SOW25_04805 [Helicobacter sp.]|nr:hypothetical protein [Helicobacter sp.]